LWAISEWAAKLTTAVQASVGKRLAPIDASATSGTIQNVSRGQASAK
jgi:hypothetical protein